MAHSIMYGCAKAGMHCSVATPENYTCDEEVVKSAKDNLGMYGKKTMGVVRTTYLIDQDGIIIKAFGKVKAADNPQQMLDVLSEA